MGRRGIAGGVDFESKKLATMQAEGVDKRTKEYKEQAWEAYIQRESKLN